MIKFVLILLPFLFSCASKYKEFKGVGPQVKNNVRTCKTAREYVTTMEFLKAHNDIFTNPQQKLDVAEKVSHGCTGAAKRFIRVTRFLLKVELGSKVAVQNGILFANSTDDVTNSFLTVFQTAYLEKYLDMDMFSSLKIAKSLSINYDGNPELVKKDFQKLVHFCVNRKNLDLPKPKCAELARRVSALGKGYDGGIYKPFINTYNFLKSGDGPSIATFQALKMAEDLVSVSPGAAENYISAYKYAINKKGMGYSVNQAMNFANKMAGKTRWVASEPKK